MTHSVQGRSTTTLGLTAEGEVPGTGRMVKISASGGPSSEQGADAPSLLVSSGAGKRSH